MVPKRLLRLVRLAHLVRLGALVVLVWLGRPLWLV